MPQPLELLLRGNRAEVEPWAQRNQFHELVNSLASALVRPGDAFDETLQRDNNFYAFTGDHGGLRWTKAGSRMVGAAGARITRLAVFESDAHVQNVEFYSPGGENNDAHLVHLAAGANVTFVNCRFRKLASQAPTFVLADIGATARFVGCWFGPAMDQTGNVFDHGGAGANIGVLGSNTTGNALGTVTSVFVTT